MSFVIETADGSLARIDAVTRVIQVAKRREEVKEFINMAAVTSFLERNEISRRKVQVKTLTKNYTIKQPAQKEGEEAPVVNNTNEKGWLSVPSNF